MPDIIAPAGGVNTAPMGMKMGKRKKTPQIEIPNCPENCQIKHTYEQVALILQLSPRTVERLVEAEELEAIPCGTGEKRATRRIPHPAIDKFLEKRKGNGIAEAEA